MLKLRRATVVETRSTPESAERETSRAPSRDCGEQRLVVELAGEGAASRREAIADVGLVGRAQVGDEVIVNTEALELRLGSGGFDVVHVNVTRGLAGDGAPGASVMKLNYTSLQHAVVQAEHEPLELPLERPVGVLALHGQLASVAWAFARAAPDAKLGYVQTEGGALPGGHSRTVRMLRERGLLAGHVTAGMAYGGEAEAVSTAGALHHGVRALGWDAAVCGPGPGIVGSSSALGHGGMRALDSAHVALALGCQTVLIARMSSADERTRHRGISHHSLTVLDLLLEPVTVALPAGVRSPVGRELRAGLQAVFGAAADTRGSRDGDRTGLLAQAERPGASRPARIARHDWRRAAIDLPGYVASGLPAETMGRSASTDPLFFAAALAGGTVLAELLAESTDEEGR